MRSIQTAMAAGAAGIVAAGEALAAGVAAAGGAVVATYAGVAVVLIGGVYYYVTLDAEPEASKPKVESFPEEQARAQSFTTPAHESMPTAHSTPAHDRASSSSDKGFDTYEGPDARVFTSDRKDNCSKGESPVWKGFKPYRGAVKTNGLSGRNKEYYQWDFTHSDIEVYNDKKDHIGSMDPKTGEIYKPKVPGRNIRGK